nr:hypothetical protein [Bacillus cereus]
MKIELFISVPIAIKELPLNLINGRVVPIRGKIPVTPPKLTIITLNLLNSAGCTPNIQCCALLTTFPFHKTKNSNTNY